MACQPLSWWEAAPAVGFSAAICIASFVGWSNSLVKKDQMEVCPLSRGVGYVSYPSHYRRAFACSILLCPQSHRQFLRTAFPQREDYGFIMFCLRTMRWVRSCLFAGGCLSAMGGRESLPSYPRAFWLK